MTHKRIRLRYARPVARGATTCSTPLERVALGLVEAVTRLSDCADPVPDAGGPRLAQDQTELAALVVQIAVMYVFNRMEVPTRWVLGYWG